MPTITTKTIGSGGGRDYSTIAAWAAACPGDLIATDQIWKGVLYNDSEFTASDSALIDLSGPATDSTRYVWLTVAAGHSFIDDSGALTSNMRYDVSKGVGLRVTGSYSNLLRVTGATYFIADRLQLYWDSTYSSNYYIPIEGVTLKDSIYEGRRTSSASLVRCNTVNCIITERGSTFGGSSIKGLGTHINTTIVRPSDLTVGGGAFTFDFANYPDIRNCAVFGFDTYPFNFVSSISEYPAGCTNNSSDCLVDRIPGSNNQGSLTYTNQFENTVDSTRDWRVKAGSDLIGTANRQQTYTNDLDIVGAARNITSPTTGAREYSSLLNTVPEPDIILIFNEPGGTKVTNHGTVVGNYIIQQGTSPTDFEWSRQSLSPYGGYLDLKNLGNGSSNMPYMTTAAPAPSAALDQAKLAIGFKVDGWDSGLGASWVLSGQTTGSDSPFTIRVIPPAGGGDFDLALSARTSGGYGLVDSSTGLTGLTFGTFYKLAVTAGPSTGGNIAVRYKLNSNSIQRPTPSSDGSDTFGNKWPVLNGALGAGFTDYGGLDGQLYYIIHDRGGVGWSDSELNSINDNPAASIIGWPDSATGYLYGSLNTTTVENSGTGDRVTGGNFLDTGTLTNVFLYVSGFPSSGKFRVGIYKGGSAGDPTGSTLVWDSGECVEANTTVDWRDMVGTYSKSVSGSLTPGYVWIALRETDCNYRLTNTDSGDWDVSPGSEGTSDTNDPTAAFPSTWTGGAGSAGAEAIKAYLVYTLPSSSSSSGVVVARLYANGQFSMNAVVEGGAAVALSNSAPTTLGTTAGADSGSPASGDRYWAYKVVLSETAYVTKSSATFRTDGGGTSAAGDNGKVVIYRDSAGSPGALVAVSSGVAIPGGNVTVDFPLTTTLTPDTYWLGTVTDSFNSRTATIAVAGDSIRKETLSYASPADPMGTPAATGTAKFLIWLTYDTGSGPGTPLKAYANGTTQILNMVEFIGPTKLYANGTFSTNSFAEF